MTACFTMPASRRPRTSTRKRVASDRRNTRSSGKSSPAACSATSGAISPFAKKSPVSSAIHGRPPYFFEKPDANLEVFRFPGRSNPTALSVRPGGHPRTIGRRNGSARRVLHLWKLAAEENGCFGQPYAFANDHARFLFFRKSFRACTTFRRKYRCTRDSDGGAARPGKDTWLGRHRPELPVVSLDEVRQDLEIEPQKVRAPSSSRPASSAASIFGRVGISPSMRPTRSAPTRNRWINLFADYRARIEIVYVEPPLTTIRNQNRRRPSPVPRRSSSSSSTSWSRRPGPRRIRWSTPTLRSTEDHDRSRCPEYRLCDLRDCRLACHLPSAALICKKNRLLFLTCETQIRSRKALIRRYMPGFAGADSVRFSYRRSSWTLVAARRSTSVLHRLARKGVIRRLARGVYDFPKTHPVLGPLQPSAETIAKALAGRDHLRLQPAGAYAANALGLSEQVPAKAVFLTDGPSRTVKIGPTTIQLRRTTAKNMATAGRLSGLLIQALRELGRDHVTPERSRPSEADAPEGRSAGTHQGHPAGPDLDAPDLSGTCRGDGMTIGFLALPADDAACTSSRRQPDATPRR